LNKRIFGTLFFSIFATVTGVGIVVPLLPVYAHHLGAGGLYIGMIFAAFSFSRTVFLPYFGRASDTRGRKPFITLGLFAYALISAAFILAHDVDSLIILRFVQGIASAMIMPVVQAYVGDITPAGKEGSVMGVFNMSMFTGLSLGPLVGGFINDRFSLQSSFMCMGALALMGFFLSLFLLPPRRLEQVVCQNHPPVAWRRLAQDRHIAALFFFRFAYTCCIGVIWGFVPVYADARFSLTSSAIGILIMAGVLVSGLVHLPMGYLADRVNRRRLVLIGGLIVTGAVFSYALAGGFQGMLLCSLCFGIGGGMSMPALMAISVQCGVKSRAMGSVMALLTMAHSLGMLAGSMLAGVMMEVLQLRYAFILGALLMLLGSGLFFALSQAGSVRSEA
jgi:DHA1 family multidrug resistance protein-like MFS transporter